MSHLMGWERVSIVEKGLFSEVVVPCAQTEKKEAIYFEYPLIGLVNILCFNVSRVGIEIEVELLNVFYDIRIEDFGIKAGKKWICKAQGVFDKMPEVIESVECGWQIDTRASVVKAVVNYFEANNPAGISKELYNNILELKSCSSTGR